MKGERVRTLNRGRGREKYVMTQRKRKMKKGKKWSRY